jgi:hypothetical protein
MKSGNRLALMVWLALVTSAGFSAPSSAQKNEVASLNARIAELSRAGKYSEAIPLAQRQLESLEKTYGPLNRDVAASLNNLALLYGDQGAMPRPSRCTSERWRSWKRCMASTALRSRPA